MKSAYHSKFVVVATAGPGFEPETSGMEVRGLQHSVTTSHAISQNRGLYETASREGVTATWSTRQGSLEQHLLNFVV